MPRRKPPRPKLEDQYTLLIVRVDQHDAGVRVSPNGHILSPQNSIRDHDSARIYPCVTTVSITGTITYPEDRAGHELSMTIHSEESPSADANRLVKDIQARDEYGSMAYRKYRGELIPVYDMPPGLGLINKVRGEPAWSGWAFLPPRAVSDMLALVGRQRQLFMQIQERKRNRARWVYSMSLQTADPAAE